MIDFQSPAEAVDPIVSEDTSTGAIIVEAFPTNGILYRARIFDDEENIVSQQDWLPTWCGSSNSQCTMTFEYQDARGETLCCNGQVKTDTIHQATFKSSICSNSIGLL